MALLFAVKDGAGSTLPPAFQPSADLVALQLDPTTFPMLAHLEPWGRTLFNRRQTEVVMRELDALADLLGAEGTADVAGIKEMCQRVLEKQQLYLAIIGE